MFGAIMPAPLAMPATRAVLAADRELDRAPPSGFVSVVMMARAARGAAVADERGRRLRDRRRGACPWADARR